MSFTQYNELISAASAARLLAYAPYSGFQVGAALVTKAGKIYTGCNVENLSLGLTICAERSAIATAIAQGSRDFVAIAVVTEGKKPAIPCGACRQVLAEFNADLEVIASTTSGRSETASLSNLLPHSNRLILGAG